MRKYCLILWMVIWVLPGCSANGTLILYNSTVHAVSVRFATEGYGDRLYRIASSEVGRISLNVMIENIVVTRIGEDELCYLIPEIPSRWIAPGIFRPKIYAKLSPSREIFLFSTDIDEETGFNKEPPGQPDGFPLEPTEC